MVITDVFLICLAYVTLNWTKTIRPMWIWISIFHTLCIFISYILLHIVSVHTAIDSKLCSRCCTMTNSTKHSCSYLTSHLGTLLNIKPEVHNVSQRRQRRTEQHAQKLGEARPCGFWVMRVDRQTDKQTNKQTYILITILCTLPGGEVTILGLISINNFRHNFIDTYVSEKYVRIPFVRNTQKQNGDYTFIVQKHK